MLETRVVAHLDHSGVAYLDAIDGDIINKLSLLQECLPTAHRVLSIGVGKGTEIKVLKNFYPTADIVSLDISSLALKTTPHGDRLQANAIHLPLKDGSFDAVVYSSVLHEVYSYLNGRESLQQAVSEGARMLTRGGCLFIRDPAAPWHKNPIGVRFLTKEARAFTNYFTSKDIKFLIYPEVAELLMHFRNFMKDLGRNQTFLGDRDWKELREAYFIYDNNGALTPDAYVAEVLKHSNGLKLVAQKVAPRPETNAYLAQHFSFYNHEESDRIIENCTRKMELVFSKT